MDILKEVIEVTYAEIVIQSLLCVTVGLILAMVIEEFKKQDMKMNGGLQAHWQDEWILLKRKWNSWNMMHPNEQVKWEDYYDANRK